MKTLSTIFTVALISFFSNYAVAVTTTQQPELDLGMANAKSEIKRVMGGGTTRAVVYGEVQNNLILFQIGGFRTVGDLAYVCNMVVSTDLAGAVVGISIATGHNWSAPFWEVNLSESTPSEVLDNCVH